MSAPQALLSDYRAGLPVAAIARRHGVSQSTIARRARRAGISRPAGRPSKWPDCPAHLLADYQNLCAKFRSADEARAFLEAHEERKKQA